MIFENSIFEEKPSDNRIRRLYFPAVTPRQEYLSRCKARALAILTAGDKAGAITAMLYDVAHWKSGELYDAGELEMRRAEATFFMTTLDEVRAWIEEFN